MSYLPLSNTIFSGNTRAVTPAANDNDTSVATTAFVQTELGDYLLLAGGTMTGDITLGSGVDINFNDTSSGLQWSDVRLSRSAANIIAMGSGDKIQQNAAPTAGDDLTNKFYVDSLANGLDWKASVRVATAAALPAYTRTGNTIVCNTLTSINTAGVDSVTDLAVGNRILLKNGAAGADNGIWEVTVVGVDASTAFELARTEDANAASGEVTAGMAMFVSAGTVNGDQGWVLTTNDPITLNTTALTFTQFSSASVVSTLDSLTDVDTSGVIDGALLRYESSGTVWNDTIALLFSDAGQLQNTTTGSGGGILLGGDAQWYRSAADTMRTPDALVVDGLSTLTGAVTASAGVTATTGGFSATAGDITAVAGNISATVGTLSIGSTSTLTGLVTATGGITTATGSYTTTGSGSFTASSTGVVSTNSGNISSTSGNLVITAGTATVGGLTSLNAGVKFASTTKTADYSAVAATDYIILVNAPLTAVDCTITLPENSAAGTVFHIKDIGGNAETGTNVILIDSADNIDGTGTAFELTVNYQSITVVSDGANYHII